MLNAHYQLMYHRSLDLSLTGNCLKKQSGTHSINHNNKEEKLFAQPNKTKIGMRSEGHFGGEKKEGSYSLFQPSAAWVSDVLDPRADELASGQYENLSK